MPTSLDRVQITVGPVVERALELADKKWPGLPRAEQLTRMLATANDVEETAREARRAARRKVLEEMHGTVDYPPGYLEELRNEWPE